MRERGMRAIDTNVLVRILARDDAKQVEAAEAYVRGGAWIALIVLVETAWVLDAVYSLKPAQIADGIELLLDHEQLVVQDADVVAKALAHYRSRPALGFSDCLILEVARKAAHLPLGTFDRGLARLEGVEAV